MHKDFRRRLAALPTWPFRKHAQERVNVLWVVSRAVVVEVDGVADRADGQAGALAEDAEEGVDIEGIEFDEIVVEVNVVACARDL
jgi:hypothetical protein